MNASNVVTLGRNFTLKGAVSKPGDADPKPFDVGVIILGMGIAEVQIARRLKRLGFVVLQVRLIDDPDAFNNPARRRAIYDESGVARVREAMDYMSENHGLQKFFLMGTCAGANLSINTALQDSRVTGLVPINMHFSELLTHDTKMKQKLVSWEKWKLFFTGKANYRWLKRYIVGKLKRATPNEMVAQWDWHKDMVVPINFGEELENLARRGVSILMVYSHQEDSLAYLTQKFDDSLAKLASGGRFTLKVIETETHVYSRDQAAANILNDFIDNWFKDVATAPA